MSTDDLSESEKPDKFIVSRREFLRQGLQDSARGALKGISELWGVMGWLSGELEEAQDDLVRDTLRVTYVRRFQTLPLGRLTECEQSEVRFRISANDLLTDLYQSARSSRGDEPTVWTLPVITGARLVNRGLPLQLVGVLGPAEAWLVTPWVDRGQPEQPLVNPGLPVGVSNRHDWMGQYSELLGVGEEANTGSLELVELSHSELPRALASHGVGAFVVDREQLHNLLGYRGQFNVQKLNWTAGPDGPALPAYGLFAGIEFIEAHEELLLRLFESIASLYDTWAEDRVAGGSWYLPAAGYEEPVVWLLDRALKSAPQLIGHRYVGPDFIYKGTS